MKIALERKKETMLMGRMLMLFASTALVALLIAGCATAETAPSVQQAAVSQDSQQGDALSETPQGGILSEERTPGIGKLAVTTDYSNQANWLALPAANDKAVDVVYFYPTAYSRVDESCDAIADIDDDGMRAQAQGVFQVQATVFEESCNVYAPYYRQVDGAHALTVSDEDNAELMRGVAFADPAAALDYYFENLNGGRPFILAGHSQGSEVLVMLLADYMGSHPEYYKNMVAAYVVGYSVTGSYLKENPHLKFATGASDTGVIVSYNTEGPGNADAHNAVVLSGAVAINPLTWALDDAYAGVEHNVGSLQPDGTLGAGIADARIDVRRGVVVCSSVDPAAYGMASQMAALFGPESYHGSDYGFYYGNLKENVAARIAAFE